MFPVTMRPQGVLSWIRRFEWWPRGTSRECLETAFTTDAPSGSFDSAPVSLVKNDLTRRCAQDDRA